MADDELPVHRIARGIKSGEFRKWDERAADHPVVRGVIIAVGLLFVLPFGIALVWSDIVHLQMP